MSTKAALPTKPLPGPVGPELQRRHSDVGASEVARIAWKHWQQLAYSIALGAVIGLTMSVLRPKQYVATASFVGTSGSSLRLPANVSALAGLAGQLGLLPG